MQGKQKAAELANVMYQKGLDREVVLGVLTILETEDNFVAMLAELSQMATPSKTWVLAKALLIAEPEKL